MRRLGVLVCLCLLASSAGAREVAEGDQEDWLPSGHVTGEVTELSENMDPAEDAKLAKSWAHDAVHELEASELQSDREARFADGATDNIGHVNVAHLAAANRLHESPAAQEASAGLAVSQLLNRLEGDPLVMAQTGEGRYPFTISQEQARHRYTRLDRQNEQKAEDEARERSHTPALTDKYADPSAGRRLKDELAQFDKENEREHPELKEEEGEEAQELSAAGDSQPEVRDDWSRQLDKDDGDDEGDLPEFPRSNRVQESSRSSGRAGGYGQSQYHDEEGNPISAHEAKEEALATYNHFRTAPRVMYHDAEDAGNPFEMSLLQQRAGTVKAKPRHAKFTMDILEKDAQEKGQHLLGLAQKFGHRAVVDALVAAEKARDTQKTNAPEYKNYGAWVKAHQRLAHKRPSKLGEDGSNMSKQQMSKLAAKAQAKIQHASKTLEWLQKEPQIEQKRRQKEHQRLERQIHSKDPVAPNGVKLLRPPGMADSFIELQEGEDEGKQAAKPHHYLALGDTPTPEVKEHWRPLLNHHISLERMTKIAKDLSRQENPTGWMNHELGRKLGRTKALQLSSEIKALHLGPAAMQKFTKGLEDKWARQDRQKKKLSKHHRQLGEDNGTGKKSYVPNLAKVEYKYSKGQVAKRAEARHLALKAKHQEATRHLASQKASLSHAQLVDNLVHGVMAQHKDQHAKFKSELGSKQVEKSQERSQKKLKLRYNPKEMKQKASVTQARIDKLKGKRVARKEVAVASNMHMLQRNLL